MLILSSFLGLSFGVRTFSSPLSSAFLYSVKIPRICSSMLSSLFRYILCLFFSFVKRRFYAICFLNCDLPNPLFDKRIIFKMYKPAQNFPVSKSSTLFAIPRSWYISCQPSSSRFCYSSGMRSNYVSIYLCCIEISTLLSMCWLIAILVTVKQTSLKWHIEPLSRL